jgi:hypothetical protein
MEIPVNFLEGVSAQEPHFSGTEERPPYTSEYCAFELKPPQTYSTINGGIFPCPVI